MSLVHSVFYEENKSYDFYNDHLVVAEKHIQYQDIGGLSYLLTRTQNSVNLIPTHNSYSFSVKLDIGEEKPYSFGRYANSPLFIHSNKQRNVQQIYIETVQCIDALIAPIIIGKAVDYWHSNGEIEVGNLRITQEGFIKKGVFKEKFLNFSECSGCITSKGSVCIMDNEGKLFWSHPLSTMNAPLLPKILQAL